ncbi:carbonic anhydrase 9-like isoform X1 [Saccoglossus kowalevskii]
MNTFIIVIVLAVLGSSHGAPSRRSSGSGTPWGYHFYVAEELGPDEWWQSTMNCVGMNQSPIDLKESESVDECFGEVEFTGFGDTPPEGATMTLENTGHYVKMLLTGDYLISGGGLGATYKSYQFHFHWGNADERGSEHYMNSEAHPAEMHIVTYDTSRFSSGTEATGQPDGLAVFAFLIELQDEDNEAFSEFFDLFEYIEEDGDEYELETPFSIESLLPEDRSAFYRYSGSLTTPPCSEGVVWTNFVNTIKLSEDQLNKFRGLKDELEQNMKDNFRAIQPLRSRTLFMNSC